MTDCTLHQTRFSLYHDQELADAERLALEAHLAACPHCAEEWRLFGLTLDHVADLRHGQPPADLLAGIHAKLDRQPWWARLRDLVAQYHFSLSLPAATATVAVAMAVGLFFKAGLLPLAPSSENSQLVPQSSRRIAPMVIPDSRLTPVTSHANSAFPRARAAHPPMIPELDALHPDIFITVEAETPHDLALLQHDLAARNLAPYAASPHVLRVRLTPDDLPLLREALGQRESVVFPPETVIPGYPHHKDLLLVAIRLQ